MCSYERLCSTAAAWRVLARYQPRLMGSRCQPTDKLQTIQTDCQPCSRAKSGILGRSGRHNWLVRQSGQTKGSYTNQYWLKIIWMCGKSSDTGVAHYWNVFAFLKPLLPSTTHQLRPVCGQKAYIARSPTFHKFEFEVKIYFFFKVKTWSYIWIPKEEFFSSSPHS